MHTERVGQQSRTREVYAVHMCSGCRGRLAAPHVTLGWLQCSCAGEAGGHRTWFCLDCRVWTYDPPHDPGAPSVSSGSVSSRG